MLPVGPTGADGSPYWVRSDCAGNPALLDPEELPSFDGAQAAQFRADSAGWLPDYQDPAAYLNVLLEDGTLIPTFQDPAYRARLAATARLSGAERYLTYARLDADLARNAAPLVAFGNLSGPELFSARMGCQTYGVYGIDLAALCIKKSTR